MERLRIEITGIVQGVGFRPFVYNLASSKGIKGFVLNDSKGVIIEAEGERLEEFITTLKASPPPLARIEAIKTLRLPPVGYKDFEIRESIKEEGLSTLVSPDIAVCKDCLEELFDPSDRRYLYPFINCTNCGPRYSITLDIPYDRPNTTMKAFKMCKRCEEEYHDPFSRRFHAQPNACPECGPKLQLRVTSDEFSSTGVYPPQVVTGLKPCLYTNKIKPLTNTNALKKTVELLKDGAIVAIKGLGGFHLACNATNDEAVKKLRERKRGSNKPFAIMLPDIETIRQFCVITCDEEMILNIPVRPIVLIEKKKDASISDFVAPENNYFGCMLPYTPLHYLLFYYPLTHNSSLPGLAPCPTDGRR
ncbi:MAG: carbamoyltransferase HypF, partial [Deltaproteobacteria bacterium]|nr:carbamoyltransferase HypF [Deltaproteobacteria bacterium]